MKTKEKKTQKKKKNRSMKTIFMLYNMSGFISLHVFKPKSMSCKNNTVMSIEKSESRDTFCIMFRLMFLCIGLWNARESFTQS